MIVLALINIVPPHLRVGPVCALAAMTEFLMWADRERLMPLLPTRAGLIAAKNGTYRHRRGR